MRTGDLGYFDSDGDLFLVGRVQESILQGGVNVTPSEIEVVIGRIPDVMECAVTGVPDSYLGDQVVAFVVRKSGSVLQVADVLSYCRSHLEERKVPIAVRFVEALPKTELGKIRKAALREQFLAERNAVRETPLAQQLRDAHPQASADLAQQAIRGLLQDLLGETGLDANAPLGQLGLTSLLAVRFANALSDAIGRPVPATICFEYPTIAALTQYVLGELVEAKSSTIHEPRRPIATREPIAIIGMGCRFPGGADTAEQFWQLLECGSDCIQEVPRDRFDIETFFDETPGLPGKTYTKVGAFLTNVRDLDARPLGLTPAEARKVSIYESLALQVAVQAFRDAGYEPSELTNERVGVYVGSMVSGGKISGAISYRLNLQGPCVAVDAECASSLVAVHAAVQGLRNGECDVALAGGIFVLQGESQFVGASQLRLLSADGRCKTFDARADGIGLGEGCGFVLLKRLPDARQDSDRIVSVIRGTAINHGGRSSSPTAPSVRSVEAVITAALRDAGVDPNDVGYLETHGTGTALGDPMEVRAISLALAKERKEPLVLGALKANLGHLQAAAGIAGFIKAAMVVERGVIPPNIHLQQLNPLLKPYAEHLTFPTQSLKWQGERRIAGVTSMGLSGANAHVVLEQPEHTSNSRNQTKSLAEPTAQPEIRVPASTPGDLLSQLRIAVGDIVDLRPEEIGESDNLFDLGMDSLRVLDFLEEVRRLTGIQCQPSDLVARPRFGEFVHYLGHTHLDIRKRPQLMALRDDGSHSPLFCLHAIDGEVTPYVRLSALLGPKQPVYAVQSARAPVGEYSISKLAETYADVIQERHSQGDVTLLGWSMGAILAHAVACNLENAGRTVARVLMLDPPRRNPASEHNALSIALLSSIYSLDPSARLSDNYQQVAGADSVEIADLRDWCIGKGILKEGIVSTEQFSEMIDVRMTQIRVVREHSLARCKAPLRIWWAAERDGTSWSSFSESGSEESTVSATHFSVIRPPAIEQIVREIEDLG